MISAGGEGFKVSRFQSFKVSRFQSFKVSRFQSFKVSRFQSFKVSRFQGFKVSRFQGFKVGNKNRHGCPTFAAFSAAKVGSNALHTSAILYLPLLLLV
jgi:hypothetical protein